MTGLSSEYLYNQVDFLAESIRFVYNYYDDEIKPPGIVLIGHSMGGIIIQSLFSNSKFSDIVDKVSFVISFATPYKEPRNIFINYFKILVFFLAFLFDSGFLQFWNKLKMHKNINFLNRTISISSGLKDEFIDEEWTRTGEIMHITTMELDGVWLETDHKCIIWCNQLMKFNFFYNVILNLQHKKFIHNIKI